MHSKFNEDTFVLNFSSYFNDKTTIVTFISRSFWSRVISTQYMDWSILNVITYGIYVGLFLEGLERLCVARSPQVICYCFVAETKKGSQLNFSYNLPVLLSVFDIQYSLAVAFQ